MKHRLVELMAERQARTGERLTATAVAEKAGVSKQTLYNWINQGITRFDADTVVKLCTYFGCKLEELLYIDTSDGVSDVQQG